MQFRCLHREEQKTKKRKRPKLTYGSLKFLGLFLRLKLYLVLHRNHCEEQKNNEVLQDIHNFKELLGDG